MLNSWKSLDEAKRHLLDDGIIVSEAIDDAIDDAIIFIDNKVDNKMHHFLEDINAEDVKNALQTHKRLHIDTEVLCLMGTKEI